MDTRWFIQLAQVQNRIWVWEVGYKQFLLSPLCVPFSLQQWTVSLIVCIDCQLERAQVAFRKHQLRTGWSLRCDGGGWDATGLAASVAPLKATIGTHDVSSLLFRNPDPKLTYWIDSSPQRCIISIKRSFVATLLVSTILVTIRSYFESHHCFEFWIWMNVTNYYNSVINQRQTILYGVSLIYFKRKKGSNWDLESCSVKPTKSWKHTNITADTIIETSTRRYDGQLWLGY